MKTELKLYDLWYDGTVQCKAKNVEQFISLVPAGKLVVDQMTADIEQYNQLVTKKEAIKVKTECAPFDFDWNIPDDYLNLDIKAYLIEKIIDMDLEDDETSIRLSRTLSELKVYARAGLIPMLRCLVYMIETFNNKDVVWGVGRGSSVASYVLYLIGVHDIDCIKFELPFSDFMR